MSAQDTAPLKTKKDRTSYAMGADLGKQLRAQNVEIDPALVERGRRDALSGGKTLLSDAEVQETLEAFQEELRTSLNAKNKKEGEDYLAKNKSSEGVVTLASGLQYKILKAGEGPKPTLDDTVVCHYRGTFINGTEFDSSYRRNQPASFPVKGVIKGWTEALQLMTVGSRWQLAIPRTWLTGNAAWGPSARTPRCCLKWNCSRSKASNGGARTVFPLCYSHAQEGKPIHANDLRSRTVPGCRRHAGTACPDGRGQDSFESRRCGAGIFAACHHGWNDQPVAVQGKKAVVLAFFPPPSAEAVRKR